MKKRQALYIIAHLTNLEIQPNNPQPSSSAREILDFLKGKDPKSLNDTDRNYVAGLLDKTNFNNNLQLPEVPKPGDKLYGLLNPILTTHTVFKANKKADEAWMLAMVSEDPAESATALERLGKVLGQVGLYERKMTEAKNALVTKQARRRLNLIRQKINSADEEHYGIYKNVNEDITTAIERTARRCAMFGDGIQAGVDLDKTLTESDDYLNFLPHAMQFENFMGKNGREVLAFVMSRYARECLLYFESIYNQLGKNLTPRPGVNDFLRLTAAEDIPLSILSANFRPIVEGFLTQFPVEIRHHIFNVTGLSTNDITASDKEITTAQSVLLKPDRALLLYVDGVSDAGCFKGISEGLAAGAFVLAGTPFVDKVRKTGVPVFPFNDFNEVNQVMGQIIQRRSEIISQRRE